MVTKKKLVGFSFNFPRKIAEKIIRTATAVSERLKFNITPDKIIAPLILHNTQSFLLLISGLKANKSIANATNN